MSNMFITNYGPNEGHMFEALFVVEGHKVLFN